MLDLFLHFLGFSLLSVGGAITVAPEMHRYLVDQTGLLSDSEFNASIAVAQIAPGPNVLFVAVMGYQSAGLGGAFATMLGIMLPSTTIALAAARWGEAHRDLTIVQAFRAGLAPVTVALMMATGWILATPHPPSTVADSGQIGWTMGWILTLDGTGLIQSVASTFDVRGILPWVLTIVSAVLVVKTRIHLLWLIVGGACTGALGWL